MTKKQKYNNSKQKVRNTGENVEVTFSFSKAEYDMLKRVADERRRSIRSTMLTVFRNLDYKQEVKKWV